MEYVILASQPIAPSLCRYIAPSATIVAVDAGWQQAQKLGLTPDLVLGDFDSAPPPPSAKKLLRLPAEKDDTDTYYAARYAVAQGATQVSILGGLGGRLDHTLANLQTLLFLAGNRVQNLMADEQTEIGCVWPGRVEIAARPGWYLSVFAAGGPATGVCLQGVKYPLQNATLTPSFPLGVSNEFAQSTATIQCATGFLLVCLSKAL